jgi:predicted methyltransferase
MITIIGEHKVKHGDIMDGIADLMRNDKADIFYSDPPWGEGNLKYWQTMNVKMNSDAVKKQVDLNLFLNKIFETAATYAKGVIFIEYGERWADVVKQKSNIYGLKHICIIKTQYGSGKNMLPLDLHILSKQTITIPSDYVSYVWGSHGYETLKRATAPFIVKGGIVLDPCCGMGYSAQVAVDNEMRFRGNELNQTRLNKTIKRLIK